MSDRPRRAGTFPGLVAWLQEAWASEPFPDRIHRRGVFFGQPDSETCPPHARLSATYSSASELTGGSLLGSPATSGTFMAWMEQPSRTDKEGYYITPLRSALDYLAHGSRPCPVAALMIWTLIRLGFDWHEHARSAGWSESEYAEFVGAGLSRLRAAYSAQDLAKRRETA